MVGTQIATNRLNPRGRLGWGAVARACRPLRPARGLLLILVLTVLMAPARVYAEPGSPVRGDQVRRSLELRRLGVADGLSQAAITAITQDKQGYIWIGTQEGLNRFDGRQVVSYSHDPSRADSLSHDWVWDILVDRAGAVWIATNGGGISRFDHETGRFEHLRHDPADPASLPGDRVRVLLEDQEGRIWIGTEDAGLGRLDPDSLRMTRYGKDANNPHGLTGERILDLYEDRRGTIWVAIDGGGLLRWNRIADRFQAYRKDEGNAAGLGSDRIRSVYESDEGELWVGTMDAGLFRFDRIRRRFQHVPPGADGSGGPAGLIRDMLQDKDGTLWIASDQGICEWQPASERFNCYRHDPADPASLPGDRVTRIFQDRGGVLWIGTYKGAASWNYISDAFRYVGKASEADHGLSDDVVTSLDEDADGTLWIGTYGGGLNRLDLATGAVRVWREGSGGPDDLPSDRVMAVHAAADGAIWVGTRAAGLARLDPTTGTWRRYRHDPSDPQSLSADGITRIASDPDGTLWIGTFGGGLNRLDPAEGRFTVYRHDPADPASLGSDRVLAILRGRDGSLWVGTEDAGLNELGDGGRFRRYRHDPARAESLSSDTAWDLLEAGDGSLWVATLGGGVNRWQADDRAAGQAIFQRYTKRDGLASGTVMSVKEDGLGTIWLSSNNGLTRLDPVTGALRFFDAANGLKSNDFTQGAGLRTVGDKLVLGTSEGLVLVYPRKVRTNRHPPQVAVQVTAPRGVVGHAYSSDEQPAEIDLSYKDYTVSFELAALDFASPDKNRFRYRLEGFDRDWVASGPFRRATYTNLPARSYRFRAEAINNNSTRSERGAELLVRVRPPPWRTYWAYAGYTLLAVGTIGLVLHIQRKKLRWEAAQRHLLEEKVKQRTQEITERNQALEELNERLKQASITDALTGLKNRRYFYEAIEPEVAMIRRLYTDTVPLMERDRQISLVPFLFLMMIDLDGFKLINDTYGHHAGDAALRQVRDLLRRCCRNSDTIVRWGGDEFLVFGRTGGRPAAEKLAERIRCALADHQYQLGDGHVGRLSGSIGLAPYPLVPGKPDIVDWETTLAIADQASYIAKKNRRNAWVAIYATGRGFKAETPMRIKYDLASLIEQGIMHIQTSIAQELNTLSDKTETAQV